MTPQPKILIVGAGIGGLASAIALRQEGFEVEVFERAPELKEVGAGIGLASNATRVLHRWGLLPKILEQSAVLESSLSYTSTGRVLARLALKAQPEWPSVGLHRADLQQTLHAALPPHCVRLGEEFVRWEQTGPNVTAHFASGRTASGRALIGADGLRSLVRAQLLGDGEPVYRGYQCWRGVCPLPGNGLLTETFGRGVRVGLVPIGSRGTAWWCTADEPKHADDLPTGAKAKVLGLIANWHAPIASVIEATDPGAIIKTPICDRPPAPKWGQGGCVLLGDAAHPTTPNMGQGGSMAIEDAAVLARCLASLSEVETALVTYTKLRRARTARVTRLSLMYGWVGQWKNPGAVGFRNVLLRLNGGKAAARAYQQFVAYDPFAVPVVSGRPRMG